MIQRDLGDGTYASYDEPVPPLPPVRGSGKKVGDPCAVCGGGDVEKPCQYGNCPHCGGHSEHNWGCREVAR